MLYTYVGTAPITNGTATVTVNGLECGVTYYIIAGGTLNGQLVGPKLFHGNITTGPCLVNMTGELYIQMYVHAWIQYTLNQLHACFLLSMACTYVHVFCISTKQF